MTPGAATTRMSVSVKMLREVLNMESNYNGFQNSPDAAKVRMRVGAPYSQDFYRKSIDLSVANWGYRVKNRFYWLRGPGKFCGLSEASN